MLHETKRKKTQANEMKQFTETTRLSSSTEVRETLLQLYEPFFLLQYIYIREYKSENVRVRSSADLSSTRTTYYSLGPFRTQENDSDILLYRTMEYIEEEG